MKTLTPNQIEALRALAAYVGKTVLVLTSEYTAKIDREAVAASVATISSPTLRGLQTRGFIRITNPMWRGAEIEVIKIPQQ